ncbi:Hypothetical predicted protein, partial [Paramuricea clavata]
MPSPGKKRKKEASKEDTSNQPKKVKRTKKRQASEKADGKDKKHLKDKDHCDSEEEDACSVQSLDIDQELDKNASKSNLSVFNVKSIIHHVLSDERVVAMARKAAENDDDDDDNTKGETYSVLPSIM